MGMAERMTERLRELQAERQHKLDERLRKGELKPGFNRMGRLVVVPGGGQAAQKPRFLWSTEQGGFRMAIRIERKS